MEQFRKWIISFVRNFAALFCLTFLLYKVCGWFAGVNIFSFSLFFAAFMLAGDIIFTIILHYFRK